MPLEWLVENLTTGQMLFPGKMSKEEEGKTKNQRNNVSNVIWFIDQFGNDQPKEKTNECMIYPLIYPTTYTPHTSIYISQTEISNDYGRRLSWWWWSNDWLPFLCANGMGFRISDHREGNAMKIDFKCYLWSKKTKKPLRTD